MRVARCGDSIADNYVKAEVLKNSPLSVQHRRLETGNMSPHYHWKAKLLRLCGHYGVIIR